MKTGDNGHGKHKRHAAVAASAAASAEPRDGYLSLTTQPGGGATVAVGSRGLNVHESLHRFDANVHLPTCERGISSANRVGEPLALLAMQWRLVPEDFDGTDSAPLPDTELRGDASQRVVMRDGRIAFYDGAHGTLLFSGSGRTYPAITDGRARLLFAGVATVSGGTGSLEGAHGTLLISGEVTRLSTVALSLVGRIDAGGPVSRADALTPMRDQNASELSSTMLMLVGDVDAAGHERLRVARVGTDIASRHRVRSLLRVGARVGTVATTHAWRVLTFCDPAGLTIGSITALCLETTSRRDVGDRHTIERHTAFGPAMRGTGALTGAGGLLTLETTVDPAGLQTTLYSLLLVDPKGRFRASFADVYKPMPPAVAATVPSEPPAVWLRFADGAASGIPAADHAMLRNVEAALADGTEMALWLEERDRANTYRERFELAREPNDVGRSFGFFDTAAVGNAGVPVMGAVCDMFFDRQSAARDDSSAAQLQAFVLKYFLRVAADPGRPATLPGQRQRRGAGYRQLYYKRRDSGKIGLFAADQQSAIVDLREIGTVYDWIVLRVDAFDFPISFAPFGSFGSGAPIVQLPLQESSYLVIGPSFVHNQSEPSSDVLARYGLGYAFVPYTPGDLGMIAYGPGHFAAAIQTVDFSLIANGEIRVRSGFVVNRPKQIARVDIDPIDWGFRLADLMTFGAASRIMSPVRTITDMLPLRITGLDPIATSIWLASAMTNGMVDRPLADAKQQFEKGVLTQHALQQRELLTRALFVWRMAADWTDEGRLPAFCRKGAA
jgi:hypothetical protein